VETASEPKKLSLQILQLSYIYILEFLSSLSSSLSRGEPSSEARVPRRGVWEPIAAGKRSSEPGASLPASGHFSGNRDSPHLTSIYIYSSWDRYLTINKNIAYRNTLFGKKKLKEGKQVTTVSQSQKSGVRGRCRGEGQVPHFSVTVFLRLLSEASGVSRLPLELR
jgi:hypothetical protein